MPHGPGCDRQSQITGAGSIFNSLKFYELPEKVRDQASYTPGTISFKHCTIQHNSAGSTWEPRMDILNSFSTAFTSINWEVIVQLTMIGLIIIAGPAVIFLLAARGGDL